MSTTTHARAVLLTASICTFGSMALAAPLADEPSKYGRFEQRNLGKAGRCEVVFKRPFKFAKRAFDSDDCSTTTGGITRFSSVSAIGSVALPVKAKNGDEFHVLSIPSARGGNAVFGCDLYFVVVNAKDIWSSAPMINGPCGGPGGQAFSSVQFTDTAGGPRLQFSIQPTAVSSGASYEVRFGVFKQTATLAPPKPTSTKAIVRDGTISGPFHATAWRHVFLADDGSQLFIDEPGKCNLEGFADSGEHVQIAGTLESWASGEERFSCATVKKTPKAGKK